MSRIDLLIIDKDMNTFEVNIPNFMLQEINYDPTQVKNHESKKDLNAEISDFLRRKNQ